MRHIQGNTDKGKFESIDGLLDSLLKNKKLVHEKLNKKKGAFTPFNVSGYAPMCSSGDIICACLSLAEIDIKKAVIVIDEYVEKTDLFVKIKIVSEGGAENAIRTQIKKGVNSIDDARKINKGDKVSLSIEYPEGIESPKGIWVAMRGEQLL